MALRHHAEAFCSRLRFLPNNPEEKSKRASADPSARAGAMQIDDDDSHASEGATHHRRILSRQDSAFAPCRFLDLFIELQCY